MSYDYEQFCSCMGRELRRIREDAGLSRQQLADRSGISRKSVERYESGDDVPMMTYMRLCVALGEQCGQVLERVLSAAGINAPKDAQTRRQ